MGVKIGKNMEQSDVEDWRQSMKRRHVVSASRKSELLLENKDTPDGSTYM